MSTSSPSSTPRVTLTKARVPPKRPLVSSTRKSSPRPAFNTSLNSYSRTDPFTAFNTLVKLLSSLPSRIGGCQFKLSPSEHVLSLHLLAIVEPFITLTPPTHARALSQQPTEILDSIVGHIESRADLLSLAVTCKRMNDVVTPRHLSYRVIRCKVSSLRVWNHLIVHRSLARNVRRLEILDERAPNSTEVVPRDILESDTDMESTDDELTMHDKQERFLIAALGRMARLVEFKWACNHSPLSIESIWPLLVKCSSLKEIDICDNLVFSASPTSNSSDSAREGSSKTRGHLVLPHMHAFTLRSTQHSYGATKHPELSRISSMLGFCPNLQELNIMYTPPRAQNAALHRPSADDFLLSNRWTNLTHLTLTNLRLAPAHSNPLLASFLGAHPLLESLSLDLNASSTLYLPNNALPRLRELNATREFIAAVLACPSEAPRPLEALRGFRLSSGPSHITRWDSHFIDNLRRSASTVKRVELGGWYDMEDIRMLVECMPKITWLDVGKRVGAPNAVTSGTRGHTNSPAGPVTNMLEWAELLGGLSELTAFHGIKFFYELSCAPGATSSTSNLSMTDRSRIRKNDEIAGVLSWKCRKLRRVDHWEEGTGKVIVLLRNKERDSGESDKALWDVRRIKI